MKPNRKNILSRLDDTVRWTGIPARVADEMSAAPSLDRQHRPLRWIPIWPIAFSCALFALSLTWPAAPGLVSLGGVIVGVQVSLLAVALGFHMSGPLGKPSREDDEREASLRKESVLVCLGLLAGLNCLGQPILLILSHRQNWQIEQGTSVAISTLMLNATLLGSLPTLYASWNLRRLPHDDYLRPLQRSR
jgi:hypothetical protein